MLVLDDTSRQCDTPEDTRDDVRVVSSAKVGPDCRRIARRMDPMFPFDATGDELAADRPVSVVNDRRELQPAARLPDTPHAPTLGVRDDAKLATEVHARAPTGAGRLRGCITASTSPYSTASSGAMNRSRSMSFMTCSMG